MADPAAGPALDPEHDGVDVVVIGASAGGVTALANLMEAVPVDTGAALLVVLHIPATGTSVLADILGRRARIPVQRATDDMALQRGTAVVARSGQHLLVADDHMALSTTARVNGHRPAIDPLFESASLFYGPRVLGILLSGMLDDGVAGLGAIRAGGGITAVQDPREAAYPGMPKAAIEAGVVHRSLPLADLAKLIATASAGSSGPFVPLGSPDGYHPLDSDLMTSIHTDETHTLSPFTCPNCGGSLWTTDTGGIEQYECRVGHRYSTSSLFQVQGEALDDVLWAAHRALLERADLARRMARRMRRSNLQGRAGSYDHEAEDAVRRAASLHEALVSGTHIDTADTDSDAEIEDIVR